MSKIVNLEFYKVDLKFLEMCNLIEKFSKCDAFVDIKDRYTEMEFVDFEHRKDYEIMDCKILTECEFDSNSQSLWITKYDYDTSEIETDVRDREFWEEKCSIDLFTSAIRNRFDVRLEDGEILSEKEVEFFNKLRDEINYIYKWVRDYDSSIYEYVDSLEFIRDTLFEYDFIYNHNVGFIINKE